MSGDVSENHQQELNAVLISALVSPSDFQGIDSEFCFLGIWKESVRSALK